MIFAKGLNFKGCGAKNLMVVGVASVLWALWNARNVACFRNVFLVSPVSIISQISHYTHFWDGLQKTGFRDKQRAGANRFLVVANEMFYRSKGGRWAVKYLDTETCWFFSFYLDMELCVLLDGG
jgi:hypothetical protein